MFTTTPMISRISANEKSFQEAGIRAIQGRAHFVGPDSLQDGDETLVGRHLVIAAGARHAPLAIPGEEHLTTSTEFLDLEQLPRRVAFVGGGYIAFEFAQIAARAGAEVSILHRYSEPRETSVPVEKVPANPEQVPWLARCLLSPDDKVIKSRPRKDVPPAGTVPRQS